MRFQNSTLRNILVASLLSNPGWLTAQGTSASLTGSLRDPSGAIVVGSMVEAVSVDSGRVWSTLSNADGIYTVTALPPGRYSIKVQASGF